MHAGMLSCREGMRMVYEGLAALMPAVFIVMDV